jgi:hypothetical protein
MVRDCSDIIPSRQTPPPRKLSRIELHNRKDLEFHGIVPDPWFAPSVRKKTAAASCAAYRLQTDKSSGAPCQIQILIRGLADQSIFTNNQHYIGTIAWNNDIEVNADVFKMPGRFQPFNRHSGGELSIISDFSRATCAFYQKNIVQKKPVAKPFFRNTKKEFSTP